MTSSNLPPEDLAPAMVHLSLGPEGGETFDDNRIIIGIPETTLSSLDPVRQRELIGDLSKFILAASSGKTRKIAKSLPKVLAIEGLTMSIPGIEGPVSIHELFGSFLVSGSSTDLSGLQE